VTMSVHVQLLTRIFLVVLIFTGPVAAADEQSAAEVRQRLEAVQAHIRAKRARFAEEQEKIGSLNTELARLETEIGDVARRLHETMQRLEAERAKLRTLQLRKRQQFEALARHRAALADQLRAAYMMGRQEKLKLLLNQQDPQIVGRMLVYYDYFNRARGRLVDQANQNLLTLRVLEDKINAQHHRLKATATHLRRQQVKLKVTRERREQVLAALRQEIVATGHSLDVLMRNEDNLKRLLKSIQTALADIPDVTPDDIVFSSLKGKLPWPSPGPIEAHFGDHRAEDSDIVWQGVVIGAHAGTAVRAVSGGRVAFADWMPGYGLLAIIDHGDGYMSLYGHNQSLYKSVGTWVEAGELIARVGDGGGQAANGLYFEIRYRGDPVDPAAWCKSRDALANR
jgi:septal ring factor EnvC (AmiA/AmiB activator)